MTGASPSPTVIVRSAAATTGRGRGTGSRIAAAATCKLQSLHGAAGRMRQVLTPTPWCCLSSGCAAAAGGNSESGSITSPGSPHQRTCSQVTSLLPPPTAHSRLAVPLRNSAQALQHRPYLRQSSAWDRAGVVSVPALLLACNGGLNPHPFP